MISFVALAADAQAKEKDFYVQVNAGGAYGTNPKVRSENNEADITNQKNIGSAPLLGVEAGYRINDKFRTSLSLDYLSNFQWTNSYQIPNYPDDYLSKYKVISIVGMINGYYNITEFKGLVPYITAGLGVSRNQAKYTMTAIYIDQEDGSEEFYQKGTRYSFAYKIGLGTTYSVNEKISLDARYQYVNLGKFKVNGSYSEDLGYAGAISGKVKTHQYLVGLAFKF